LLANAQWQLILYILSPLIVFVEIVFNLFFANPYHTVVNFFLAVQPLYVFCGVACISAAVIGYGGRFVARMAISIIMGLEGAEKRAIRPASLGGKPRRRMVS
jgi:hypothetical protein